MHNRLIPYLEEPVVEALGLPQEQRVRYFKTNNFQLFPQEDIQYADVKDPLAWVSIGFISDLQDNVFLLEGAFPPPAEPVQDSVIDVMISEAMATELGLQVGEEYITFARRSTPEGQRTTQLPIRISGVWRPMDPTSEFWFYTPSAFEDVLMVSESTFVNRLSPYLEDEVYQALWYMVMDGSDVHATDALPLLNRITVVQQKITNLLPDTRLDVSPVTALQRYWRSSRLLTILLYAFSVPITGLLLAFIGLVVGLAVSRRRNEIAVLRSRGATAMQVIGIAVVEGLLLGAVGLIAGAYVGMGIAQMIGKAASFLDFSLDFELAGCTDAADGVLWPRRGSAGFVGSGPADRRRLAPYNHHLQTGAGAFTALTVVAAGLARFPAADTRRLWDVPAEPAGKHRALGGRWGR